jgi:hypothetical protein
VDPVLKKKLKKSISKFQKDACSYYLDTYSCKISSQNTTVCGLHKKDKMEFVFL